MVHGTCDTFLLVQDVKGNTPLHAAAAAGKSAAVGSLLGAGADSRALNTRKHPPLQLALAHQHSQAVYALVSHALREHESIALASGNVYDASPDVGRWAALTMSEEVREQKYQRMTHLLLDSRLNANALPDAVDKLQYEAVQLLLQGGADPRAHRRNRGLFELCVLAAPPFSTSHATFGELPAVEARDRDKRVQQLMCEQSVAEARQTLNVDLDWLCQVRGRHCGVQVALAHAVGLAVAARLSGIESVLLGEQHASAQVRALLHALQVRQPACAKQLML